MNGVRSFHETIETTSANPSQPQTYPVDSAFDGGWSQATNFDHHSLNSCLGSAQFPQPALATPASATGGYGSIPSNPTDVGQRRLVFGSPTFNHLPWDRGLVPALGNTQLTLSTSDVSSFAWTASQNNNAAFDGFGQIHEYDTLVGGAGTRSPGLHKQLTDVSFVDGGINFANSLMNNDNDFGLTQAFSESDCSQGFGDPLLDPSFGYVASDVVGPAVGWATMNSFPEPPMTGSRSQSPHLPAVAEGSLDIQQNFLTKIGSNIADYYGNDHLMAYTQANVTSFPSSQTSNTASATHRHRLKASRPSSNNAPPIGTRNSALTLIRCAYPPCTKCFRRNSDRVRHENSVHLNNQGAHLCPIAGCDKSQGDGYSRADKVTEHLWKKHADLGYVKA